MSNLDVAVNTIKALTMDAIEAANSGHPGMPMGMADTASVLWSRFLRFDPDAPDWPDRDRFVLSAGHGSMLLYSLLHLSGFEDMTLDQIKQFRQWGSRTAGHPEFGFAGGIETTTGPLGQGITNAVGMALAEQILAGRFPELTDHYTYTIAGDGDLMEGIASEAASLAGHLELGKLVVLYDDNKITIDGSTDLSFSEEVCGRFEAMGWHTLKIDGHDRDAVATAIEAARAESGKPSLIACRTHIGHGSPNKQDSSAAHGSPLGTSEVALVKQGMGWPTDELFRVPDEARAPFQAAADRGRAARREWLAARERMEPARVKAFDDQMAGRYDAAVWDKLPEFATGKSLATRKASHAVLNAICGDIPQLIGGSADLTGSVGTHLTGFGDLEAGQFGADRRYIRYGVREHAMAGMMNGMSLHGGIRPYAGTFLVFSDYMRPSVRLAALMHQPVIFVWTHDSVFLGEDGPTHQPVEHAMALRLIPNLHVVRPGDANETAAAWRHAMERTDGPTALLLTRQGLPVLEKAGGEAALKGGYVLADCEGEPDVILLATGSELHIAMGAGETLTREGVKVRVVSMPCFEAFEAQSKAYRDDVLPPACRKRVAIEAGRTWGWERYVGDAGASHGIDRFGTSAPAGRIALEWGFTAQAFADKVRSYLAG